MNPTETRLIEINTRHKDALGTLLTHVLPADSRTQVIALAHAYIDLLTEYEKLNALVGKTLESVQPHEAPPHKTL
jgi:hypothetical protein